MTGAVKSVGKLIRRTAKGVANVVSPKVPEPDMSAVNAAAAEAERGRAELLKSQEALKKQQSEAAARLEAEQRELAAQGSGRRRAARRGGIRSLLSDERLNPETGLGGIFDKLGG